MKNKINLFFVILVMTFSLTLPISAQEENYTVNPGDEPIEIYLGESNEYTELLEKQEEELSELLVLRSTTGEEISELLKYQTKEINAFDQEIIYLRDSYSKEELKELGNTDDQIDAIINFDSTDEARTRAAAVTKSWITLYKNSYDSTKNQSTIDYGYTVQFSRASSDVSVATGIKSAGYYQRQNSSYITGVYTTNGVLNGSNTTYKGPTVMTTVGDAASYRLAGTYAISGGRYVQLSQFTTRFIGVAQGNHKINNILARTARQSWSISGIGFGISGGGPSLSLSLKNGWTNINTFDRRTNR